MTKVFVVTFQHYLYGDEVDDDKSMMLDPVQVKGVFSTKEKAKRFIKNDMQNDADSMYGDDETAEENGYTYSKKEFIEEYTNHYDILTLYLDKINW